VQSQACSCQSISNGVKNHQYSNPSEYEQSVYEFSLIRDAQINTCFSVYEPIFAYTSSFLSQIDRCSRRLFSGSNGKLNFILWVFALPAVLEERIKLVNRGIIVLAKKKNTAGNASSKRVTVGQCCFDADSAERWHEETWNHGSTIDGDRKESARGREMCRFAHLVSFVALIQRLLE
jgi:hypothetical protein